VVVKRTKAPIVLSRDDEEILKAVHFYRYMTARDVAHSLFPPPTLRRVRDSLVRLCGGDDFKGNQYLYRFRMPKAEAGNPERIYTLGSRGREFLVQELGVAINWHVRPEKGIHLGFSQLMHNLVLTRVLVATRSWAVQSPDFRLIEVRICYEMGSNPVSIDVETEGKMEKVSVIPDAWILFERLKKGEREYVFPVLLEIDRGTMYRQRFKRHVLSRIEFVASGEYRRVFGQEAVVIAYATTGATGEMQEGRRRALCSWTMEALKDSGRESWAEVFRFCSLSYGDIYERNFFQSLDWYRPDLEKVAGLFGD
jgi:protein involved in plasmid replication-relaxation